jgi:hypothetical protein
MKSLWIIVFLALCLPGHSVAQSDPWADEVVLFEAGAGAGFGQAFFPDNVLGPPDSTATALVPSNSEEELLTLGFSGVIVLEFTDNIIVDLEGVDFTIFENSFYIGGNPESPFVEAGIVSVSEDGITWTEFPYDTSTYEGLAGVTPTNGGEDPTDPSVSGGDSFDLSDIGIDEVRFVRIADAADLVPDLGPSFDLDAVVAVHSDPVNRVPSPRAETPQTSSLTAYPNPCNPSAEIRLSLDRAETVQLKLYDAGGREVKTLFSGFLEAGERRFHLSGADLPSGCYWLVSRNRRRTIAVLNLVIMK